MKFSKYKNIDHMYVFKILEDIVNPNSKYTPFECYGAIGVILLLNKWIVIDEEDEYINEKLNSIIEKEYPKYYGLYTDLKRVKFKKIFPLLLDAIYEDNFILFFSLLRFSEKYNEDKIEEILNKGLAWKVA